MRVCVPSLVCSRSVIAGSLPCQFRLEAVDDGYVSRPVNLTTLAPHIVAAILDETLPPEVTPFDLTVGMPVLREEQQGGSAGLISGIST